ncbi:fibrous sheath-interacting protein 2 isoform X3 [Cardiocondyla obscurior]|uniref:fibrous sheath-interacting protein 2 isoform X3 n=1 Tax=Cardiocondyla obscurior TaxID=286306 RepID=UPI00396572C7
MIGIRRITDFQRFTETVPKPKGSVPKYGLPGWKLMPLEHKIPMVPGPKAAYNFTRCKVGKKLWRPKLEFDLSDPYCRSTKFSYEPLHDEHLAHFFSRPNNLNYLLKVDLITSDMNVKCSLRDYNEYRKYLRQVHADYIKRELRKRDRLIVERMALNFAEKQARKEVKKLKEKEKVANERQRYNQEQLLQVELRNRKLKERARKTMKRFKLIKTIKQEERKLMNNKREKRTEQIRQKNKIAAEINRRKVISTLIDMRKADKARKKTKDKRLLNMNQKKQKDIEEKWKRKLQFQEKDIERRKMILQRIDNRRKKFIDSYNEKINRETAKMKRILDNAKLFTNCYMKRHLLDGRKLICCKKYCKSNTVIKKN